ncbi:MAG: nitric-oxide reductase large subunit [Armatimonadetes bacterium]|nr:nitric-oxide reductase large subunit [Armatimonadota bacterium]
MARRRLWLTLVAVMVGSFGVLGYYGRQIYHQAPPVPDQVVSADGQVLFTGDDIREGQSVWRSIGGQECGSVWGHGAYVAPDWSADWLHREATWLLETWAQAGYGQSFASLDEEAQAGLLARLKSTLRTNTYDANRSVVTVSADVAQACAAVAAHYTALFGDDASLHELRLAYAMPESVIKDPERQRQFNAFIWWSAWACATNRPNQAISYTSNWPAEDLVGNRPTAPLLVWSALSVLFLLAAIGTMVWFTQVQRGRGEEAHTPPELDPLAGLVMTPSMRAAVKYFWVVIALIMAQVGLGIVTAHYGVEGQGFYGVPLAKWLPYSLTRTWHVQLGIFWIATAWLGTGLFVGPIIGGHEPRYQKLGVNLLFVCLLIIVVGSFAGEWLGVQQKLGLSTSLMFGHQGLEYVDLGRFWQAFLFLGLFIWLGLVVAAMLPALRRPAENRQLLGLFALSSLAIAGFYGAGLSWGQHTNLAVIEYWRWWVVHLWVEGFFEVFATVVIAFLFSTLGLVRVGTATSAALATTCIYLTGGIIGTMHHLYFSGTPIGVLAWGASFSALEVVPLVLVGFEAYENLSLTKAATWMANYRWPVYFFMGVAFWNLVGAGLFGFLINPPISLYYMQGLNTTPVHGHAALFGVYGMLGIGLMLFCLRAVTTGRPWRTKWLAVAFWCINVGLALMLLLSLLPVGLLQTWASVEHGYWYARSAEFLHTPQMQTLRWMRAVGDSIFGVGSLALAWFVIGLHGGWSVEPD